jgi:uncharacterized hydrophobic protein (TIGR00271 family)
MKILFIVTHAEMARLAMPWILEAAQHRNAELLAANCVLNPVAVPGRESAWPLIEKPQKVRNALKETIDSLPKGSVTLLDEIRGIMPSHEVSGLAQKHNIETIYFPVDARLDPSAPDMQFGLRLLRDAPSNVMLLDIGKNPKESINRFIVPMDLAKSGHAIRYVIDYGSDLGTIVPLHISPDFGGDSQNIAARELDLQLREVGLEQEYSWLKPKVAMAEGFHQGLMQSIKAYDGILMGGASVKLLHDIRREIIRIHPRISDTIAIGIFRPAQLGAKTFIGRLKRRMKAALPELTLADRVSLFDRIQGGARLTPDFIIMIGLSVLIASLGLITDNTSVVIGAMLVAPFMTSLIGIGLALAQGNLSLMKRSAVAMGTGLFVGLSLSFLMGAAVPMDELPLEVLARGDPNIVDLAIAFISGMAAAYAVSRESVAESIVGVAIAAALVPPLACVGIMLSEGHVLEAEGAITLLVTNLAAIILGAAYMFRRLGVPGTRTEQKSYVLVRRVSVSLIMLLLLLSIPLVYRMAGQLAVGQIRPANFRVSNKVKQAVHNIVDQQKGLSVMQMGRSGSGLIKRIRIVLAADRPVHASLVEDIRASVQGALGKDIEVVIGVFRNAVEPQTEGNTKTESGETVAAD